LSVVKPPPNGRRCEEEKIFWRQTIIGYYPLQINSPPETSYKTNKRFQGWYGDDGVIAHIMKYFVLVGEYDKIRIKRLLVNVKEWASSGGLYKGLRIKGQGREPMIC
jgi:hypothetical protein